jgi:uncharacterized protein with von Willebrand factor type A (vWA) domain
VEVDGGT